MKTAQACSSCNQPLAVIASGAFYCWWCDGHMSTCRKKGQATRACRCYK